jgi:CubicO group peptidase (beta-lactamase class C family)
MKETVVFENRNVVRHRRAVGYELAEGAPKFKEGDAPAAVFAKTRPSHFEEADAESVIVGDGGIWSNLDDLAKWDAAVREKKLLKAETWEQAFTPLHLDDGSKPDDYGFGWGLTLGSRGKLTEVWHDGGYGGFETTIRRYLVPDLTTVILCNMGDFEFDEIEQAIHDLYVPKKSEKSGKGPKKKPGMKKSNE